MLKFYKQQVWSYCLIHERDIDILTYLLLCETNLLNILQLIFSPFTKLKNMIAFFFFALKSHDCYDIVSSQNLFEVTLTYLEWFEVQIYMEAEELTKWC